MKKTLLIVLTISILGSLGFLGFWGIELYQFAEGVRQDVQRMEKVKEQHPTEELIINKESTESRGLKEILLTETKLGNTNLNELNGKNIKQNLKSEFQIKEDIGHQDGPDFKLYQVNYMNEELFFISMDSNDSMLVQDIWTENPKIKDEYGTSVGITIDTILTKRPDLNFHSDHHYNVYASAKDSKIQYRLNGNLKSLNDSLFVAEDFTVEKWQTAGMKVEYLIWRK